MKEQKRTIAERPVSYTCERCGQERTEMRYPGPTPKYCPECKGDAQKALAAARMRRMRAGTSAFAAAEREHREDMVALRAAALPIRDAALPIRDAALPKIKDVSREVGAFHGASAFAAAEREYREDMATLRAAALPIRDAALPKIKDVSREVGAFHGASAFAAAEREYREDMATLRASPRDVVQVSPPYIETSAPQDFDSTPEQLEEVIQRLDNIDQRLDNIEVLLKQLTGR